MKEEEDDRRFNHGHKLLCVNIGLVIALYAHRNQKFSNNLQMISEKN